jgi:hypothetical protein
MHKLENISPKFSFELVQKLRLQRHSNVKRSDRKRVANLKEEILALSFDELEKLKEKL